MPSRLPDLARRSERGSADMACGRQRENLNVVDVVDADGGHNAPGPQCSRPLSSPEEHAPTAMTKTVQTTTATTRREQLEVTVSSTRTAWLIACPVASA
jgi:hypothetical protein